MSKGFLITITAIIVAIAGFLAIGTLYEPDIPVEAVSGVVVKPVANNTETLSMIEAMQADATKINWWTKRLKNKAEKAYELGDVYPLGEVDSEIQRLARKIWDGRGETAPAFEICDDNLISDLSLYNLAMLAKLDGKERAEHELPYFKDNFYDNYNACKKVIFRQTAQEIYDGQF